ncbi:MAG: efflux RND transporter periplasmic adaptor subunit [Aquificae bacterium]|nr:efflux RND transporter periplasmic adaptor subunit [Aquificota bacterium]
MKNKVLIVIIALISALVGLTAGFVFKIYDKVDFESLIYKEDKTIKSENLPVKTTTRPVDILTVEQLFNIDTTVVRKMKLAKTIETYADVVHPETDLKEIVFKIDGYVEEIYADFTGKYIKKGQPLVKIYSPELVSAQEEFLRAYEYLKSVENSKDYIIKNTAKKLYEASYKKLLYWDITPKQIENLKKTKKVMKTLTLYSPYDGWIMEKYIYLGSKIQAGKPLFRIANHEKLWVLAKIYEPYLSFVKEGLNVELYFDSYPDKKIIGKIDYIYPIIDFKNRTIDARIVIDNKNYKYIPKMYSKVIVKIFLGEKLVLPDTAVINTGKRQIVFWQKEKGVFEPVFVKLGMFVDGFYEIKEGLHEGMVVANSALFLLDADAQLRGKYSKDKKQTNMIHHH